MFRWFSQVFALTAFNLKTVGQRLGSVLSAVVGMALVVTVLVFVLSIGAGFAQALRATGSESRVIVLRSGADSEMMSVLMRDDAKLVAEAPGIASGPNGPLVSSELFVVINLPQRSTGTDANVPLRGLSAQGLAVHDEVEIVEGRAYEPGRNEVIVGRAAQRTFSNLEVGKTIRVGQNDWAIVGAFTAGGGSAESEIWTDAAVLQPAYRRGSSFQAIKVTLASEGSFQRFKDALTADPRLDLKILRETDFYAGQSRAMSAMITGLGAVIAVLMGLGAVFGALNTMYTAVAARAKEIATLRALGFKRLPVIVSVIAESALVAIVGGVIGGLLAWGIFDGYQAATMNWSSFSSVAFAFAVTPPLLAAGIVYALLLGLVGGFFPALRAARQPIVEGLRD
jgi:putative ABC transport system permease protein